MWLATGSYSGKSPSVTQPGPASACVCQCCWRSWVAVACNSLANAVLSQVEGAERSIARLVLGQGGQMRIAVECHICFDWLMPAMDAFRTRWPEVELDIVSGFHGDPVGLLHQGRADAAILKLVASGRGVAALPLWAVQGYLNRGYVTARPIGQQGLTGELHAACMSVLLARP